MGYLNEKLLVTVQKLLERDFGETFWLFTQLQVQNLGRVKSNPMSSPKPGSQQSSPFLVFLPVLFVFGFFVLLFVLHGDSSMDYVSIQFSSLLSHIVIMTNVATALIR